MSKMVLCPNCKKHPLYLIIRQEVVMSISAIGLEDVIPDERADDSGTKILECLNCGWKGWTRDYHKAVSGIVNLFNKETVEEKL